MANERLRSSIIAAGHHYESLAASVGVDPKTVERWVTLGRVPHRTHRSATANLLGRDEGYLWPTVLERAGARAASEAELVHLFPTRGAVPRELWQALFLEARNGIDLLAYAGLFLLDNEPELAEIIRARAEEGVRVRILLGDPASDAVSLRGAEEGVGTGLAERIRMARRYLQPSLDGPGVEVREHGTTLYSSIYRSDTTMLVNVHAYGSPAAANPVLHLQRVPGGRLFDRYQQSFDRVWNKARVVSDGVLGSASS